MNNNKLVRNVAVGALFVALAIVAKFFLEFYVFTDSLRIGFAQIPVMLASLFLGPFWGGAVGGAADVVGYLLKPTGPYHFGFLLSNILMGVVPYLAVRFLTKLKNRDKEKIFIGAFCLVYIATLGVLLLSKMVNVFQAACAGVLFVYLVVGYNLLKKYATGKKLPMDCSFFALYFSIALMHIVVDILLNTYFLSQLYGLGIVALLPMRVLKGLILIPIDALIMTLLSNIIIKNNLIK